MKVLAVLALFACSAFPQTATRLSEVRKIYVEKMDNGLDASLREEIGRRFGKSLIVVATRPESDAVLVQVKLDPLDKHDFAFNLTDSGGKAVLWSGSTSDIDFKLLGLKRYGADKIARHLVRQLKKAMLR
jgi:hypothetical protein